MNKSIEIGDMAFIDGRSEAVGAVRVVSDNSLVIYVENSGDYSVHENAVAAVHDGKVVLDGGQLEASFLRAVEHSHDREVGNVAG